MVHPIGAKSGTLLIIEPNSTRRSVLVEGFKKLGFPRVNSAPGMKDAIGIIEGETQPPDWVLTGLLEDQSVNAFHLLQMIIEHEPLRRCRVSLIVDAEQRDYLPKAFALGLYTSHGRFPDAASQMAALTDVFYVGERYAWSDCLTSAHYLRELLKDLDRPEDLERLETRLLALYPEHIWLGVKLAEALFLSDRADAAQRVLDRLPEGLDDEATQEVEALTQRIQKANATAASGDQSGLVYKLRLERCLVVDPDESIRKIVKEGLAELGVATVIEAADGEDAWKAMQEQPPPDLVVQEWRLPKLGGDLLVQRARTGGLMATAIVVFSSLVKAKDRMLLREMGVTDVIEKPMSPSRLARSLVAILKEERRPKTVQGIERQIRVALERRDHAVARRLLGDLQGKGGKDADVARAALEAEIAFQEGNLQQATDLATSALHIGGEDVLVLNLLGKIHLKLGKFSAAARYFDQAQKLSPQNVGRLVALAEAQAGADQADAADATITKAKAIDAGNDQVIEAEAKVALAKGDAPRAREVLDRMGSTPGIVAFVNNRAVTLVNQDRVRDSIDLYKTALKALPTSAASVRPIINYNLALALLRLGDVKGADGVLKGIKGKVDRAFANKVISLTRRTEKALLTGEQVVLNLEPAVIPVEGDAAITVGMAGEDPVVAAAAAANLHPGDLCCYLIYDVEATDPRVLKLLPTGTAYRGRKALQKGGDKRRKSG